MQDIITNMRGNRAFQISTGKIVTLALAASTLLPSAFAPALAAPMQQPLTDASAQLVSANVLTGTPKVIRPLTIDTDPRNVTLDFVSANIADVLRALSIETHTNIVSGPDVTGKVTVSLANVTLENALNIISRVSGFQYAKEGSTYIVGTPASLATFNTVSSDAPPATAVVGFNYSDPTQLTQIIANEYPNVKVSVDKAEGTNVPGGVLILTGQQSDVSAVRDLVSATEQGLSKNIVAATTVVYQIKYAAADDLQTVLGRLDPNLIVTPGPSMRLPPVAPTTANAGGVTSTTTAYGAPGGMSTAGAMVTSVTGNLPMKPTTDSLILTGSASDITRARQILAEVDIRPAQINFQAKIADINNNLYNQLGLTYSFAGAQTFVGQEGGGGAVASTQQFRTNLPIGYTPLSQFVNIGLQAAQNNNEAHILASPNISAIDGQPAAIFIGNNITYVSSITSSPTGQNVTTATVSAGIKLYITGKVDHDGYITVNLHPEVSSVTFNQSAGGAQLPNIATTEATTTLRVRNGDYIALGGLAENTKTNTMNGVPILDNIPIIGALFRSNTTIEQHRQLVIFIKVTIQKDGTVSAAPVG